MAASNGFAAFSVTIKQQTSICRPSRPRSSEFVIYPYRNSRNRRRFLERGAFSNPRCEMGSVSSDDEEKKESRISSISALERLKTSAADRYTKEKSSILAIGLSFHTAPVEMREKLAIPEAGWPHAIEELCRLNHIEEAAVLSTCNRMAIYVVALSWHRGIWEVTDWMSKTSGIPVSELRKHLFLLRDKDAVRHLFEVSAGLDSLVLGEGQILSQVKQVLRVGKEVKGFNRNIGDLFRHAVAVGKLVRHETNIASGAVSVSSAAVEFALMKLPKPAFSSARMLVIGAGKMGQLIIRHLAAKGCTKVVVINRSEGRAAAIREKVKGIEIIYKPISEMLTCAAEADVVFTCTASEMPLFLKEHVESLPPVSQELGCWRLFIDISVPRNVGSCVYALGSAQVYNVDDLKKVVEANQEDRHRKAMEAQAIINEESESFVASRDSLEAVPTIIKLRSYFQQILMEELKEYLLKKGVDEISNEGVIKLGEALVNKLLHRPMQHFRCNPDENRTRSEVIENIRVINRVFGLDTEIPDFGAEIRARVERTQK
eukprot:TRINITY_DN14842_c1_g1_i2.p1 TRINITY_DN14842_c1_g1~~TRINITY_DN14842_c1_g1_i2.p1  ORF type:complete len:587 (-),score=117.36 TRINITY_DN14842_c1_g1_i2:187-1818(-)